MSFTLLEDVWPIARKDHQCTVCLGRISPGEKYRRTRFINWDGDPQTCKEHELCEAAWRHAYNELELSYDESPDWHEDVAPIIRSVLSLAFPVVVHEGVPG